MKKTVFLIFAFCTFLTADIQAAAAVAPYLPAQPTGKVPITVQHPQENALISARAKGAYLFGKLFLKKPTLQINGQEVSVYPNGTFIAYVPVEPGEFTFDLIAQSEGKTYQAQRHIRVGNSKPIEQFSDKARLDETQLYPQKPVWVIEGDTLLLSARGTPQARVSAELNGWRYSKKINLQESKRIPGLYQAKYVIKEKEKPRALKVTYTLQDPHTRTKDKATAREKIKILDPNEPLQSAHVKDSGVKVRQLPVHQGSLYPFYRAFGDVLIDGRENGLYRLRLSRRESAWLEEEKLTLFNPSAYHTNALHDLTSLAGEHTTFISWSGDKQVPVSVHEFNNRMEISFYYTEQFDENYNLDSTSPLLARMEWTAPQNGVLTFVLYFHENTLPWGHSYHYDGNNFILELHHTPRLHPTAKKPLQGTRILLDAGHSPKRVPPYDGLVSPSGILEYEANLALAEALKPKLQAAGATVLMTRQGNNHMSLTQRYQYALQQHADIFVSLHHNALPESVNPFAMPRGYSVYYTYPHSFALAQSVYESFNQHIPLADNGLIANDLLYIPRISDMPSILIESAYMIMPEQEELVMSPRGRKLFAQTIYEGIVSFFRSLPPPAVTNPAGIRRKK